MQPIEFIPYYYYSTVYYCFLLVLCWATTIFHLGSKTQKILYSPGGASQPVAILVTILMSFFIGLRQPWARDFGDSWGYWGHYKNATEYMAVDLKTEWLWHNLGFFCKSTLGMNPYEFFVLVALLYFGGMLICTAILMRNNLWIVMLFFFTAFQTFTYSVNGLRNGLACSFMLVAISMLTHRNNRGIIVCAFFMLMALSIHRSTMLPAVMAIISWFFIKDTKLALRFWYASIALSLVAGPVFESFFAALGFDDRFSAYQMGQYGAKYQTGFSHTGFRWDFLLYSSFPVIMIWYVTQYRKFTSREYSLWANTYLLCNAFWILVIRASFSNRFAYLSWFIYPVVMAYPLMRMNLWEDQDRKTSIIFFFYTGFTFFMFFIYYFGTTGFRGFDQYWWRED
jgi:hypothetical protein